MFSYIYMIVCKIKNNKLYKYFLDIINRQKIIIINSWLFYQNIYSNENLFCYNI